MGGRKGGRGKASTLTTPHVPERNHLCASKEKESKTGRERERKKRLVGLTHRKQHTKMRRHGRRAVRQWHSHDSHKRKNNKKKLKIFYFAGGSAGRK